MDYSIRLAVRFSLQNRSDGFVPRMVVAGVTPKQSDRRCGGSAGWLAIDKCERGVCCLGFHRTNTRVDEWNIPISKRLIF